MSLLGEGAIIFQTSAVTTYIATLLGGIAGIYFYVYSFRDEVEK